MGNGLYVYKENDLYQEKLYLKKQGVSSIKELDHAEGVNPRDEASHKLLKHFTKTCLLMDAHINDERNVFFLVSFRYIFPFAFNLV